jgi:hypothetical protein
MDRSTPEYQSLPAQRRTFSDTVTDARSFAAAAVELNYYVFWAIMVREVVWNRRFGTTYRSHLQGSRCSRTLDVCQKACTSWPLKMEPMGGPETSVSNHLTPRNNTEYGRIHDERCRSTVLHSAYKPNRLRTATVHKTKHNIVHEFRWSLFPSLE